VLPEAVAALLQSGTSGQQGPQAALAARLAYLMLADLGS
jgi:hypothetical protein